MRNILETKDLIKSYGSKEILKKINIGVEEGQFIAIMGPSGSGKTTFLNSIATIDTPTSGTVEIDSVDITKLSKNELSEFRRDKLGFIFQDYNLLDTLSSFDNIALPLSVRNMKMKDVKKKVSNIASRLGIDHILKQYPYELSGGQQQRVSIARAFIKDPSIIMADEPTGALDSKSSTVVLEALSEFNKEFKQTIIMVTHDSIAASYASKTIFIKDGAIFQEIDRKDKSRHDYYKEIVEISSEVME